MGSVLTRRAAEPMSLTFAQTAFSDERLTPKNALGELDGTARLEQLPSSVVCTQPARNVCNVVQGETAEKSKSRAPPVTPPSRHSSGLHIEARLWGVVPQSWTRLSPHRNSTSELVGLAGRDRSQVRGGHSQKKKKRR